MSSFRAAARGKQSLFIRSNADLRNLSMRIFERTFVITRVLYWLAAGVAAIGRISALLAWELERSHEIAILRSLGLTPGGAAWLIEGQTGFMGLVALIAAIPVYATAPALILVGALMCGAVARVQWNDFSEAFPAFLTLVATPLTFSIATGLSLGLLSFTFIKVGTGKYREISPLIWVLSVLFLLRYAFLGTE